MPLIKRGEGRRDVVCDVMPLRVVLDTDVVVAGFASDGGASRRLLVAALDGKVRLLLSTPLLVEYEAVLTRPAVLAMSGVSVEEVAAVLDELAGLCVKVAFDTAGVHKRATRTTIWFLRRRSTAAPTRSRPSTWLICRPACSGSASPWSGQVRW